MDVAIVSSTKDTASINIKENLANNFSFNKLEEKFDNNNIFQLIINNKNNDSNEIIRLYTINSELIHAENIDKSINADLFIFISKHRAKEGRKSLTVHPIGNFGKAEFGGKEKGLCFCPAIYFKAVFNELAKNSANSGYEATVEATHHGPCLEKPVLFIEIGSTEKEWQDKEAGKIVAQSLIDSIKKYDENKGYETVFVIGGSHYNYAANKAMLESNLAVGHICAKYNLESLNEGLLSQAMEKTIPKPKFVLLDWKGLGKEKKMILEILEKNNIMYKRSDRIF